MPDRTRECLICCALFAPLTLSANGARVMFDPASLEVGPFPSDALTTPDANQRTGLRMNLPYPDCQSEPSTCEEILWVNNLDGFNIEPRLRIRFTAPIRPETLRAGVFVAWLEDLTSDEPGIRPIGSLTPINSVSYDPETNTGYAEPGELLAQHRRYALVVTNAVLDLNGHAVEPDTAFLTCLGEADGYCRRLAATLEELAFRLPPSQWIICGSVFTTMSVTGWLEKARAAIQNSQVEFQRTGSKSVFKVADLASIVLKAHTGITPPVFTSSPLPILQQLEGVERIAFGSFQSPQFLNDDQVIPAVPSGSDVEVPSKSQEIFFHVYLPGKPAPPMGYPVVIVGHSAAGLGRFGNSTDLAAELAGEGIAVLGINQVGYGYGPESRLTLTDKAGDAMEIAAGGRAVDLNRNGIYAAGEGCILTGPANPIGSRDCVRQTALDLMQLVRAIKQGMDLDGDGVPDLDANRISFAGLSQGTFHGPILLAVEPGISVGALTSPAGSLPDTFRWVKEGAMFSAAMALMRSRNPPLFNAGAQEWDYDWPLRDQPAHIISVPGAVALQEYLERLEWAGMTGDPLGYASHLHSYTIPSVPVKRVLFQFAIGDVSTPNPCQTNLVRAASMQNSTWLYRHDLARLVVPDLQRNPHGIFYSATTPDAEVIAKAAKSQIAGFLANDGLFVPDVNHLVRPRFGVDLFEAPQFLPEGLNFPK